MGLLKVEKHLQTLGYPGRICILDTNEFTIEGLWSFGFDLMEHGELLKLPVVHYPMQPQECLQNVRNLINGRYPFLQEWTGLGYNRHEQGWVHHTWAVYDNNRQTIETTVPFDAYCGYRTFYEMSSVAKITHAGSPRPAVIANGDDAICVEDGDTFGS